MNTILTLATTSSAPGARTMNRKLPEKFERGAVIKTDYWLAIIFLIYAAFALVGFLGADELIGF